MLIATNTTDMKKVLIGMSGGVDSSVAAALLKNEGYDVYGVTLLLADDDMSYADDAKAVAEVLDIPFQVADFRDKFKALVKDAFVSEFKAGRTPNPCVICNKSIKFGALYDYAKSNGFDYIATGHYSKIENADGEYAIIKAESKDKDQSYFLYGIRPERLSEILMPLGGFSKDEVRALAKEFNLPVWKKRDSQDICFIPDGDKNKYLSQFLDDAPGDFLDTKGNKIGHHTGIFNYTYGQRKGIGAYGRPMFVLSIDPSDNSIVLGEKGDEFSRVFYVDDVNLFVNFTDNFKCSCKIRYSSYDLPCTVSRENNMYKITLLSPARSVTPGQACVFYDGERLLGGGTIISR